MGAVEKILKAAGISWEDYTEYGIGKVGRIVKINSDTMADPSRRHVRRNRGNGQYKYNRLRTNEDLGVEDGSGTHHVDDKI